MTHLGFTRVLIEVPTGTREFNIMIRPIKKATQEVNEEVRRGAYQSPNNPHYPRHFTTNWRECIHRGYLAYEAARQAKEEGRPHVSHYTHPDYRILEWTEYVSKTCEIHRDEKEVYDIIMKRQNEEGKGWALNKDETRRIQAYIDEQVRDGNIRPGAPLPSITKLPTYYLSTDRVTKRPEQTEETTETETQYLSTPKESEYDSTDDELEDKFDANHI
jgi:hypothetical protein